jgi:uncharacterized protein
MTKEISMRKSFSTCQLTEVKFAPAETKTMAFTGYGAVFGNIDAYGDVIEPGAFSGFLADAKSGRQPWPSMLAQHGGFGVTADDMTPIGVWDELAEDGTGLKVSGTLADTPRGRENYTLLKMAPRPAINGLSIGYIAKESEPRSKPEDPRRRLKRIDLMEISLVTFPANRSARVGSVKSVDELVSLADIEDFLREAGDFSRGEAKAIVAKIRNACQREAGDDLDAIVAGLTRNLKGMKNG